MTGIYIGTSPLREAYIGTTPVREIYVGTTKVRPEESIGFEYDFTTTNPSSEVLGYHSSYGYEYVEGSGLRTYNLGQHDRGGHCGKLIQEDISNKIITMEGTRLADFGATRTWLGLGMRESKRWEGDATSGNCIFVGFNTTYYGSFKTYDGLQAPEIKKGNTYTGNTKSAYGRTIATSGTHEIKINWELNLKNGESKALIYKNGNLHSTENYTLTADELSTAKGLASSGKYFSAEFARGYRNVTMFMKSRKVTVRN